MSEFRRVAEDFWASPQISAADVAIAHAQGIRTIVNNRPEGESEDQTPGTEIAAAAEELGLGYVAIPVTHAGFTADMVAEMTQALQNRDGPILAYCRSGTRSTLLWSLAQASLGMAPERIAEQAAAAGYDVSPIRTIIDTLATRHKS